MLACFTEVDSTAWREGMIAGLTRGYALAIKGLRGKDLLRVLIRRFNELTPPAYHAYVRAYLHQRDLYGVSPKMLSFWQWRYLAADLDEIVRVAELLGCDGGLQEEEARAALLLSPDVASPAPYASLVDHGGPTLNDPHHPHHLDGLVDAYNLCWQFVYEGGLDGDAYCGKILEYLDLFVPEDYKLYCERFYRLAQSLPAYAVAKPVAELAQGMRPTLTYRVWAALARELAVEIDRCTAAGAILSRKRVELSRLLLCAVNEPAPSLEWTLPPALERELLQ